MALMLLISQHPFGCITWHSYPVASLVVQLALLQLVVQLEDGLAVLLDGIVQIGPALPLSTHTDTMR